MPPAVVTARAGARHRAARAAREAVNAIHSLGAQERTATIGVSMSESTAETLMAMPSVTTTRAGTRAELHSCYAPSRGPEGDPAP
jgi:hypothetical protein